MSKGNLVFNNLVSSVKTAWAKFISYFLIVAIVFIAVSLARNVQKSRLADEQVEESLEKVDNLKKEQENIQKRLSEVTSEEYIEKQLRDNLGLAKDGEIVVVLPDQEVVKKFAPQVKKDEEFLPDPNWKKWLKLFL